MYFHGARFSNYEAWLNDPTHIGPSVQVVWPIVGQEILNGDVGEGFLGIQITSGFFQIWRASGITSELQLYCTAIGALVFAALMLFFGWFHYHKATPKLAWFQDVESMLNHHLVGLLGLGTLSWAGHQVHVSLPINQFLDTGVDLKEIPLPHELILNRDLLAKLYPNFAKGATPFFTLNWSKYAEFLTFRGGLDPVTGGFHSFGLYIHNDTMSSLGSPQDMFSDTTMQLQTVFVQWIQNTHALTPGVTAPGATTSTSLTRGGGLVAVGDKVALLPIPLGTTDFLVHHIHAFTIHVTVLILLKGVLFARSSRLIPDKANLGFRFPCDRPRRGGTCQLAIIFLVDFENLFHGAWQGNFESWVQDPLHVRPIAHAIWDPHFGQPLWKPFTRGGFIMTGAFAHGAISFIRDYNPEQNEDNVLARILDHKEAITSHLSWASLFLGFHTLRLYVHNNVMLTFGTPERQILIEPIFAQWIQSAHGKTSYGFDVLLSLTNDPAFNTGRSIWLPGWLNAINENSNLLFLTIGPSDFLVHHSIALGLHTTTLILVKGALDACGSKLMADKKDFGYSFPCDGPGRGGTCDISAWDVFYLAVFWMLNTIGWVTLYWHWKHITLWQGNVSQFNESSTYLMGWLRDYLWLNSSQLINGYNPFGMNSLPVWAWMFLFGHLVWATGFMFLISSRGYWRGVH
ncbi:hypothetical protein IFM89_030248 [Coptis chinensis]|uniref:photosystem I n=1 Tax=Coptis chinensis TaxID=261450 RepID=A0A835HU06_9MAGN|nr:hypothetical protein IFM89_030248 [Coptis chinensis]